MKRILLVLTVALVMATMVLVMAVPAMAKTIKMGRVNQQSVAT